LIAQRLLGGQCVTGSDNTTVDLVVQHQIELAVQRHSGHGGHLPGLRAGLTHGGHVSTSPPLRSRISCYMYITTDQFWGDPMTAVQQQAATDPTGPTGRLATWVADLRLDDVPHAVVERAKYLLLDGLGCALVGAQLPWSRVATDAVLGLEGRGNTVVIGTGQTTGAPAAAVLNGTFIQGFERDSFHPLAPLQSCPPLTPALLSTASVRPHPTTGAEF